MALMMNTTTQVIATPEQETAFKQFLTDCIEEYCRDGYYTIYWDYRDEVSPDTINKAFFDYVDDDNGYCNFEDYLDSTVFDEWSLWDYEHYLIEEIESDANNSDDFIQEILQNIIDNGTIWDYLYECGYQGLKYDIHDIVNDVKVNLLLATKSELNYDLSPISRVYIEKIDNAEWRNLYKDNALQYLIRQQGYFTKAEDFLTDAMEHETSKFLKSVDWELNNAYVGDCHCLTVLISADLDTLNDLADILSKKETAKKKITVTKDCEIGLLAPFIGGGSTLEIQLEKDFEFPADMLYDVQIEHRGHYSGIHGFYTVDDIYCLCGECWRATAKFE
jgi:hypothetical protein